MNLILATGIVALILLARTRHVEEKDGSTPPHLHSRYAGEMRVLGIGSLVTVVVYATLSILQGFVFDLVNVVSWWYYAAPLISGAVVLTVVMLVMALGQREIPRRPVLPTSRRTWLSFIRIRELTTTALLVVLLVSTTIFAGMNSSPDQEGRFVYVNISVPNTDIAPLRPWFYGWAYGIPVLICMALMIVAAWGALHINAVRSFTSPDLVASERTDRIAIGTGVARIVAGVTALSLAGALRFIADGSAIKKLTIEGQGTYDAVWRYAEFAVIGGAIAPCLEIFGFLILLLTSIARLKTSARRTPAARTELAR
ncbi:hypothetical protein E4U02_11005 [Microbacterium paludicola]|uniref:Uncharacterized protein n=1 Tax=Microbacterium paludicola TaxID=300019 RepID=A0A4Y9FU26_9MICO|nr:hypothetical protein [Microbacterium paludicola]MBF0816941.1 hypothetical protein [Microbacterium paludicola]TFU32385.1 hypothetical protein E4U02_11005 [Microbacterium paludicola]